MAGTLGLEGRAALVTGASRGIGRAMALALAREGCRVAICARGEEALASVAAEIERITGVGNVVAVPADVSTRDAADRLTHATLDAFGAIDILINNAGGNIRKSFADTTDEDWDRLLELNLLGGLRLARAIVPEMKRYGRGSILFTVSIWGRERGGPGYAIYTSTRAAVIGAANVMAVELAAHGIRVNCIAPGSILHPGGSWDERRRQDPEAIAAFVERDLPLGRFGTTEEVAEVAAFLCSDRASLVTGSCVAVDGGQGRSLV